MQSIKLGSMLKFPIYKDERGSLIAWENGNLPFAPKRTFLISNVPIGQSRANHSVNCDLIITAVSGSLEIVLNKNEVVLLNKKTEALLIGKNTFITLQGFSEDAIVLVFAEEQYDRTTYSKDKN